MFHAITDNNHVNTSYKFYGGKVMRCLVTGGAGFIGSHLVDRLLSLNNEVMVIDNLSTGKIENVNSKALFEQLDICDAALADIVANFKPNVVFHLAAQTSVPFSIDNRHLDGETNIMGSLNLVDACVQTRVKKIVFSSSAAVYGTPLYLPIDEEHPTVPLSPYGLSKLTVEKYLTLYRQLLGLDFIALRYANVYGPRQDASGEGGVIAIFTDRVSKGETPVIYGDGEQTRDFIYVQDVVDANILAISSMYFGVYNIGTGYSTTINRLLSVIQNVTNTSKNPSHVAERKGDIRDSALLINKASQELNFCPRYNLVDGIRSMLLI